MSWKTKLLEQKAQAVAEREVRKELGSNPSLARVAVMMRAQVLTIGIPAGRTRVISWIEGDLQYAVKHNADPRPVIDEMWKTARATPEYMSLLELVGLTGDNVEVLIDEAIAKKENK